MATTIIKDSITSDQARVINGRLQVDANITGSSGDPLLVEVTNFPVSFGVTQSTSPWVVSGSVNVTNSSIAVTGPLTDVQLRASPVPISGTVTANQGTSPWVVSGTVAATQSGAWTTGRTWTLSSGTDSVSAVQSGTWNINNISGTVSLPTGAATEVTLAGVLTTSAFQARINTLGQKTMANSTPVVLASDQSAIPVTQSGTWNITNISGTISLPTGAATAALQTQPGVDIGDVTINNAAGAAAVNIQDGGNSITVDGTVTVNQGTSPWVTSVSNFPATVAVTQSTSPWVVSGTVVTSNFPTTVDTNYGTVGANTIRTAAQIGNATGAADFNAGATGAQTLRVTANQGTSPWVIGDGGGSITVDNAGTFAVQAAQSGTWILGANSGVDIGDVTINNAAGAAAVNIQDGGNSITVDGTVAAAQGTLTDRSGTATNTSTTLMAANSARKYLFIQNNSGAVMWLNFTTAATNAPPSIELRSNSVFTMEASFISTEAITCIRGGGVNVAFTAKEG